MDTPTTQPTPEEQVEGYLKMLAQPGLKQIARDIALKNIARAFIEERTAYEQLVRENMEIIAELKAAKLAVEQTTATLARLRRFENSLLSLVHEHEQPAPQTSAPASPPRLSIVRNAEAKSAFDEAFARGEGPTP